MADLSLCRMGPVSRAVNKQKPVGHKITNAVKCCYTVQTVPYNHCSKPDIALGSFQKVIEMLVNEGEQGVVSTRGGRYFGFVTGSALPVSIAANWMAGAWDQNAALSIMSPLAAKLEDVAGKWILEALGFPNDCGFGFVTGASMAGFTALSAARNHTYKKLGYDVKADGITNAPPLKFVMGEEIHPTNIIALQYMGYGKNEFHMVPCDEQGRMIASKIPDIDDHTIIIAQAGNVNSGAFDPFNEICDLAKDTGAWVHVDAAFGGWAKVSETRNHLTDGMERADSWSIDCHKWLNVPYDSAIAICRNAASLTDMFGVTAPYLIEGAVREPNHHTPEFSKRARGFEIWAALKYLGKDLIRAAWRARRFGDLKKWQREFPHFSLKEIKKEAREKGELVFIFQQGWIPRKRPRPENFRFPHLVPEYSGFTQAVVEVNGKKRPPTEMYRGRREIS